MSGCKRFWQERHDRHLHFQTPDRLTKFRDRPVWLCTTVSLRRQTVTSLSITQPMVLPRHMIDGASNLIEDDSCKWWRSVKRRSHSSPLLFTFWPSSSSHLAPSLLSFPVASGMTFCTTVSHITSLTLWLSPIAHATQILLFRATYSGLEWHRSATFAAVDWDCTKKAWSWRNSGEVALYECLYRRLAKVVSVPNASNIALSTDRILDRQ